MNYLTPAFMLLGLMTTSALAQADDSDRIKVFIAAAQPGVAEFVAKERAARRPAPGHRQQTSYAAGLSREQDVLAQRIAPLLVSEHSRLRVALNGFRATVERAQLDRLRAVPGVRSVTPLRHHTLENADSVPWVQAPLLWETLGDGKGITIAVIDTGIDYLHANFGGAGNPEDYSSNDFAIIEPGSFPTTKVIGGWDFAGPTYNSREDDEPLPDPDPLDGHGHGSHVAGTAAGLGVEGHIGPGVAKGASLLALKVFSDIGGSTDLTVDAIERALDPNGDGSMDDHVDVINMSLGARFGLPTDPSAVASSHAVKAGVIVVASAGNNGDLPYVTGSPGVSPEVITVAASISGGRRQIALATSLDDAPLMPALEGAGPVRLGPEILEFELAVGRNNAGNGPGDACEPLENPGEVNGKAVIVVRGGCLFPGKYQAVQDAGGTAVVVINSSDDVSNLLVMGGLYPDDIAIPGLMITSTDGELLLEAIDSGDAPEAQMSSSLSVPTPNHLDDVIASFSSQGPGAGDANFKPDLAAPGRFTVSTQAGSGIEGMQRRGTSMAAPHVAGMAALLRQQYPAMPPASIKALLQNAAAPSLTNGPGTTIAEPLSRQGVGVMRGATASALTSRIEPAGVSFGYLNLRTSKSAVRTVTLHNLSDVERTFSATQEIATALTGVTVECPESVSVGPLGQTDFGIRIRVEADQLAADNALKSRSETSGWCVYSDGIDELRVGYLAGVDGASHAVLTAAPRATATVKRGSVRPELASRSDTQLYNHGPHKAVAHSFVLISDAPDARPGEIAAFGWRNATLFTQPVFELAVALKSPWQHPSNYRYFLRVDTDGDGQVERTLFAVDWSFLGFDPGTIITGLDYINNVDDVGSDNSTSHWMVEDVDYDDRVIILPFFNLPSGVNALFKPNERNLGVTLMVVDRYDNVSTLSGTIDLDNPQASAQGKYTLSPGTALPIDPASRGQLWLVPTNTLRHQSIVVPPVPVQSANDRGLPLTNAKSPQPVTTR